jgi:hypothetical protein
MTFGRQDFRRSNFVDKFLSKVLFVEKHFVDRTFCRQDILSKFFCRKAFRRQDVLSNFFCRKALRRQSISSTECVVNGTFRRKIIISFLSFSHGRSKSSQVYIKQTVQHVKMEKKEDWKKDLSDSRMPRNLSWSIYKKLHSSDILKVFHFWLQRKNNNQNIWFFFLSICCLYVVVLTLSY